MTQSTQVQQQSNELIELLGNTPEMQGLIRESVRLAELVKNAKTNLKRNFYHKKQIDNNNKIANLLNIISAIT